MNNRSVSHSVVHSSSTYGAATPYAVVNTTSGMPHRPLYRTKEEAQRAADQLNEQTHRAEAQREIERRTAAASRAAARLHAEEHKRSGTGEGEAEA